MVGLGGVLAGLAGFLSPQPVPTWDTCPAAQAQTVEDPVARALARRYAPVLSFAAGERYFPTLPFFTAFDGVTNDADTLVDFADADEIAPPADSGRTSWSRLNRIYRPAINDTSDHGRSEFGLERVVAFYRICRLDRKQARQIRLYLESDEQAWKRFKDDTPLDDIIGPRPEFDLIQYYFYYLRDFGLQGHPQDIELVSVFLPAHPADRDQFRIVVGSGHSDRTPNNVLVLSAPHLGAPALDSTLHVLVELGGHSSAPDLPPYLSFTPGLDVNWHAYDVWGTRDIQAVAGTGFLGSYKPEMTFERDPLDAVSVYPPSYSPETIELTRQMVEKDRGDKRPKPPHQYRLVPVALALGLDRALAEHAPVERVAPLVVGIQAALRETQGRRAGGDPRVQAAAGAEIWGGRRFDALPDSVQRAAVATMQRWRQDMIQDTSYYQRRALHAALPGLPRLVEPLPNSEAVPISAARHRIWAHDNYRKDPTRVFKAHLFRPVISDGRAVDPLRLVTLGLKGFPGDGYEIHAGFVVPAFRSQGIPVRINGFIETQMGWYRANFWQGSKSSFDLTVVWEHNRSALFSWYNGVSWIPRRAEVTGRPEAGDFGLSTGVSLLPVINRGKGLNVFRLRTGLRVDPFRRGDVFGDVKWEFQLVFRQ